VFSPSLVAGGSLAAWQLRKVGALARLFAMVSARALRRFGRLRRGSLRCERHVVVRIAASVSHFADAQGMVLATFISSAAKRWLSEQRGP
jgi:hypothetical protein